MLQENLVEYIGQSIKKNWDLPAFSNYRGETMRYSDVAEKIIWLHYIFRLSHVQKGDKIALIGKNSSHWAVAYLAVITYGAAVVPVLPDFHSEDLHHIVNHSDSVFLFVADDIFDQLDETQMRRLKGIFSLTDYRLLFAPPHSEVRQAIDEAQEHLLDKPNYRLTPESFKINPVSNDMLASIVYTSGTTGFSKGVMLPLNSLSANIRFAQRNFDLKPHETIVSFLPLAHAFGCAFEFLYPFTCGAHIVFLNKIPSPNIVLEAFKQIRPKLILSVPLVMEKIYKSRIRPMLDKKTVEFLRKVPMIGNGIDSRIRAKLTEAFGAKFAQIVIGGAALSTEVQQFLMKIKFPFTCGYGMTECGPLISYIPSDQYRMFSVGKVVDTLEIKIDSSDPANEVGEIMVRGENVMNGYYKNDEETRKTIDEDGWLHTGDLGLIDKDGYIYIKGRSKTMMLGPSGHNIYPEAVESKLNTLPMVAESLLLEGKDGKLVALVYPDMEMVDSMGWGEDELKLKMEENRKTLNQLMPSWISVSRVELHPEEFEKTPTKKVKRYLYSV